MTVALCVFCLFKVVYSQSYPSSAYIPANAISAASFTCHGTPPLKWKVNGSLFNFGSHNPGINSGSVTDGMLRLIQTLTVQQTSVLTFNGSSFQCTTKGDNFTSVPTAFIIVYGISFIIVIFFATSSLQLIFFAETIATKLHYGFIASLFSQVPPQSMSSESVSDGVLVFSWSSPWAPDGVYSWTTQSLWPTQLNYTVLLNYMVSVEVKADNNFKLIIIRTDTKLYKHWWYKLHC